MNLLLNGPYYITAPFLLSSSKLIVYDRHASQFSKVSLLPQLTELQSSFTTKSLNICTYRIKCQKMKNNILLCIS